LPVNGTLEHEKMECAGPSPALISMRLISVLCLAVVPMAAASRHFESGDRRVRVLELYTSEGCSSCPPAEAWIAGLRDAPGLWRDFVPVVFHVAYWDRLGWRDRFASPQFTARQYAYADHGRSQGVYTPGFVLDGAEWRPQTRPPAASGESASPLTVEYTDDGQCRVQFAATGDYEVSGALLGGGIVSAIGAGENTGRTLHHEFVALRVESAPLVNGTAVLALPLAARSEATRQGLAVWVTRRGDQAPLQATGGWVD
jgi:hypothetical protein